MLTLLRHGESTANEAGTFTGLLDVPLTHRGERQASAAGQLLRSNHITPDVVVTSTSVSYTHLTLPTSDLV